MLQKRYDRPRLLHQVHVRAIIEAPTLKDGNGRELRRLHDTLSQHLQALKNMDSKPLGRFLTSTIELKLDPTTTFEWQRHSQEHQDVPHYKVILDFLDILAQALECMLREVTKRPSKATPPKTSTQVRTTYLANTGSSFTVCGQGRHPLYMCRKFKPLTVEQRKATAKDNELCFNCLRSGHHSMQCPSLQRCREFQDAHHTLLYQTSERDPSTNMTNADRRDGTSSQATTPDPIVHLHVSYGHQGQVLLMTCQICVLGADGRTTVARALLDTASSSSFITE